VLDKTDHVKMHISGFNFQQYSAKLMACEAQFYRRR